MDWNEILKTGGLFANILKKDLEGPSGPPADLAGKERTARSTSASVI